MKTRTSPRSIFGLVWSAYARSALIPIVVIEMALIGVYLLTNYIIRDENIATMHRNAEAQLQETAQMEAGVIANQLDSVAQLTSLFAQQVQSAYETPFDPGSAERDRYAFSKNGVWHTTRERGGTALYYSAITKVSEAQQQEAWQLAQIDPLMKQMVENSPLVAQAYLNTHDSMNRIYPYFDVLEQYPPDMDIPTYNFYYEADALHNPQRKAVWTDVYMDPAGQGWMASCIAPVYRRDSDFLEGVVGLDVRVREIISHVLSLKLAWHSYALLVDKSGTILAMPPQAEGDWGLSELTSHDYQTAVTEDTFKPDAFNIFKRTDTRPLAANLRQRSGGMVNLTLNNSAKLAAWASIPGIGWHLLVIADESALYADANAIKKRFDHVGLGMFAGLLFFYLLFMLFLYRKSFRLSRHIAAPLQSLQTMITNIGLGQLRQPKTHFAVTEVQQVADGLVTMGENLYESNQQLEQARTELLQLNQQLEQRVLARTDELEQTNLALMREKQAQADLIRQLRTTQAQLLQSEKMASIGQLAAGVAHEINNPLAFINANITSLGDYNRQLMALVEGCAGLLVEPDVQARFAALCQEYQYDFIREEMPELIADSEDGTQRLRKIVNDLLEFSRVGKTEWQQTDLNDCVRSALNISRNELKYKAHVSLDLADLPRLECIPSQLNQVVLILVMNAVQALAPQGEIRISTRSQEEGVLLCVEDDGCGIPEEIRHRIFDPFFTTKEVGKGTGLGLSVAYGIVKAHQGHISVVSEVGKGSCFRVWLPLMVADRHQTAEEEASTAAR